MLVPDRNAGGDLHMGWAWASWPLPVFWAQAASSAATAPTPATNPSALAPLALRRWFGSLTLSSPESVPGMYGLYLWLVGLGVLALLVLMIQGPGTALSQAFDLAGHARIVGDASRRLRRAGRMLALTVGLTVLSWTGSQSLSYNDAQGREDQLLLSRSRSLGELGFEQGVLAALTPLRDVAGLGSNLPMLALAVVLLFRATAESWGGGQIIEGLPSKRRAPGWATVGWVCGTLFILYRLIALATPGSPDLPKGNCLMIESLVVPAIMLVADGVLLGWVLTELRNAGFVDPDGAAFDPCESVALMPGASLACLAALPARYVATAVFLVSFYIPSAVRSTPAVGGFLRWQSLWGVADLQVAALSLAGLAGAVAWTRGSPMQALRGYARMLATEGARLVIVLALGGLVAGSLAAVAYIAVLSLPAATWVLAAADGYAHYATLPVGLWTLSALVELAERSLPAADLAPVEPLGPGA
jgi:hypothetical protein